MTTGACGIDCTVCRLHVVGQCSTCGPGRSRAGREKLEAQLRMFGQGCPILACAVYRRIDFCLRDCDDFPCEWFEQGPHPFSRGFLDMQSRRRKDLQARRHPAWSQGALILWDALAQRPAQAVAGASGAELLADGCYRLASLHESWRVDPAARTISKESPAFGGEWDRQLSFLLLAYLVGAQPAPVSGRLVHPRDLSPGQDCFKGHHAIEATELARAFGRDTAAFLEACRRLAGSATDDADASAVLFVLPKLPVQVLLWVADEEFEARAHLLIDAGALNHLPPDALSTLANLLIQRLLFEARERDRASPD